ncbi:hypothetical protein VFPPC_16112 [Pochonia chlamydosporia 170]|uniref:Uncharacterized protein n=1 Tax=Pochonia chlamydosporia 170 TaxID=1380566 RepID=A0A179FPI7_METCM|nr:hypothetical protein VFPPC_16112 [Pochonia chlamydosporia 170]OAQ67061.2 hypothetical protein VFPPC_16112 [Pochonia chlamydosporia 170]
MEGWGWMWELDMSGIASGWMEGTQEARRQASKKCAQRLWMEGSMVCMVWWGWPFLVPVSIAKWEHDKAGPILVLGHAGPQAPVLHPLISQADYPVILLDRLPLNFVCFITSKLPFSSLVFATARNTFSLFEHSLRLDVVSFDRKPIPDLS